MSSVPFASPPAWVTCPKCAAQVPCYDPANSEYFGCPACHTYFKANPSSPNDKPRVVKGFKREVPPGLSLPLGATGTLGGYHCRITGYQVRGEQQDRTVEWREYQLRPVAPMQGDDPIDFPLQLAEYHGHWLLIRRALRHPTVVGPQSIHNNEWTDAKAGTSYRMWHRYQPVIREAQGEFDWNIIEDERLKIQELVCPPYLLAGEKAPDRQPAWYLAEHLEPVQVATAFGLNANTLPIQQGTGAAQPNPHQQAPAWRLFGVAALLLVLLAGWLATSRPSTSTTETFTIPGAPTATNAGTTMPAAGLNAAADSIVAAANRAATALANAPTGDTVGLAAAKATAALAASPSPRPPVAATGAGYNQMLVSKTIVLTHPAAVDITFTALDLTNHWVELTANLVNEQTGRGYEVTRSLEYYEGVEDGESWSEGNRSASVVISSLPPGRYHLNLYPSPEAGTSDTMLQVQVEQHADFISNFLIILVLMSVVPLWHWARYSSFETDRWANSDFAPAAD